MKQIKKIAVIGGTGKAGKFLVQNVLAQGYPCKILVRNPEKFKIESPLVELVIGDVADYESVKSLIEGCEAIISTLGLGVPPSALTIFTTATQNLIRAMQELGIMRYIVVTGLNVDTPYDHKGPKTKMGTEWMYANFPKSTHNRQEEYNLLVESTIDWTLVRLPLIELTKERRKVYMSLEDCLGDKISATDLALFLIDQLDHSTFIHKAPFISNV